MKLLKPLLLLVLSVALAGVFASCGDAAASYTVTYILGGGVNNPANPASYTAESETITLQAPTREGYTFTGWAPEGVIPAGSTGEKTFTANWTENGGSTGSVTVNFNFDGGSGAQNTQTVVPGKSFTLIVPAHDLYTFDGWYDGRGGGGKRYTNEAGASVSPHTVADNTTLYPYWKGTPGLHYISYGGDDYVQVSKGSNFTLPEGTTLLVIQPYWFGKPVQLPAQAFSYSNAMNAVTGISFPDTLTTIGREAFAGCKGLLSLELPANITTVGELAFSNCTALETVKLTNELTGYSVFFGCTSLREVDIPAGFESIASSTFSGCSSLAEIDLPAGLKTIGGTAFRDCASLMEITIPAGVTSIGNMAFADCSKLKKVIMAGSTPPETGGQAIFFINDSPRRLSVFVPANAVTAYNAIKRASNSPYYWDYIKFYPVGYLQNDNKYVIDENQELLRYVGAETVITIPAEIAVIDGDAFTSYTALQELTITNEELVIEFKAFQGCSGLEKITLPLSVLTSGLGKLFQPYDNIFPDSLQTVVLTGGGAVSDYMFSSKSENTTLTSIVFAEGCEVTSIGERAFSNLTGLETIILPDTVTTIKENAFAGCTVTIYTPEESDLLDWEDGWNAGCTVVYSYDGTE
jgi:uncharacterized repeat protein (TIGR02543 family)